MRNVKDAPRHSPPLSGKQAFDMLDDGLLKRALRPALRLIHRHGGSAWAREILFQNLVENAAPKLGIELPPLYPVRSAASWSLLYCLLRIATEMPCPRILEIGAGQSTLLLNAAAKQYDVAITTLEADEAWARAIGRRVQSEVIFSALQERVVRGVRVPAFPSGIVPGKYDLILVDGPRGSKRRSRWAALDILADHLKEEFIVIFDDAERAGEQSTIREFLRMDIARNAAWNWVYGLKDQCIVFSRSHAMLAYI